MMRMEERPMVNEQIPVLDAPSNAMEDDARCQAVLARHSGAAALGYRAAGGLDGFKEQLEEGEDLTGALCGAGYGSSSQVDAQADADLGTAPSTYRKGGRGMSIA